MLNQQPTTNNQQPTTNNQQPTTNNQQPTTDYNQMDSIGINCNECNIEIQSRTMFIDLNYDNIKNIIESNYITYIYYCEHNDNAISQFCIKNSDKYFVRKFTNFMHITNIKYLNLYDKFIVKKDVHYSQLSFFLDVNEEKKISTEEFMNIIEKGTILQFNNNNDVPILEEMLIECNTGFILKKIEERNWGNYSIDIPNYTKPAKPAKV